MAIHEIIKNTIWEYQLKHIDYLLNSRKHLSKGNRDERIGINISLIINTACYIEGRLEHEIKALLVHRNRILNSLEIKDFYKRRTTAMFIKKVTEDLDSRIERITGVDGFDSIIELLSYMRTPSKLRSFKNWEGITVLFQLRNVLAHGRQVTAQRTKAWWTNGCWEDDFCGGYRKAEDYLLKKKLINSRYIDIKSIDHIFTNKISDHFISITGQFIRYLNTIITQEKKKFSIKNIVGI